MNKKTPFDFTNIVLGDDYEEDEELTLEIVDEDLGALRKQKSAAIKVRRAATRDIAKLRRLEKAMLRTRRNLWRP